MILNPLLLALPPLPSPRPSIIKIIPMHSQQYLPTEKEATKFPKIGPKSKSLSGNAKQNANSLDFVTAKSWFYCTPDCQYGFKEKAKREIASLTKVMTAICTLEVCEKFNMSIKTTYFKVTSWAVSTNGTTADLVQHAWMTIEDLLYGLLLPSGNDAATVLSENIGAVLYFDKVGNKRLIEQIRSIDLSEDYESVKFYTQEFIACMNGKAKSLAMLRTRFANPHGLDHVNNYSCCEDVYAMCSEAMRNEVFRKITRTVTHKGFFKFFKEGKVVSKAIFWTNTNKLLEKREVIGIKTGITGRAGGCLATAFTIDEKEGFIVVLGSNSTEGRFRDTLKIMSWIQESLTEPRD